VANGRLNVTNGFAFRTSQNFDVLGKATKKLIFLFEIHFFNQNGVKTEGSGCKICIQT